MNNIHTLLAGATLAAFAGLAQAADPRPADMLGNTCAGCHGTYGASNGDTMPSIGGLNKAYLHRVMTEFANDSRPSTIMGRIARGYSDLELQAVAAYLAGQPWVNSRARTQPSLVAKGRSIAQSGCDSCHGGGGTANRGDLPRLAGQWPEYLLNQLREYHRPDGATPQPMAMREMVQALGDDNLQALAHYYASQQ